MADTDAVKEALDNLCSEAHYNGNTLTLVKSWRDTVEAALASRPAEVDDMMPVTEPVAWRHTLDEGSYFANGRNYQLLDDWDAAFADWMLHGGVLESLYSGPDTHELKKVGDEEKPPIDCSGRPSSCPDNEGYGCHCSQVAQAVMVDRLAITKMVSESMQKYGVRYQCGMGGMIVDIMEKFGIPPSHTTNKEK